MQWPVTLSSSRLGGRRNTAMTACHYSEFLQLVAKLDGAGAELDGPAANLYGCTTAGGGSGWVTAGGGSVHNAFRFISGANVGCCFTIWAAGVGVRLVGRGVRKGKQVVVVVGGGGGRGGGCEQQ